MHAADGEGCLDEVGSWRVKVAGTESSNKVGAHNVTTPRSALRSLGHSGNVLGLPHILFLPFMMLDEDILKHNALLSVTWKNLARL